jgi:hypothetical protein
MLFAVLAYHEGGVIEAMAPEEDAALMVDLHKVHDRLTAAGKLGPAARLSSVDGAVTLRGPGGGTVIDGPFAETKEHLLGLYVLNCADRNEAIAAAQDLRRANPTAVYEIRPITVYLPGVTVGEADV